MIDQGMVERLAAFRGEVTSAGLGNVSALSRVELGDVVFELLDMLGNIADDLGVSRTSREDSIHDDAEETSRDDAWKSAREEAGDEWRYAVLAYFENVEYRGPVVVADRWDAANVVDAIASGVAR